MKKTLSFFVIIGFLVSFCGCSVTNKFLEKIDIEVSGHSSDICIEYGEDVLAEAEFGILGGGILNLKITSPEKISGLEFAFDNGNTTLSYKGLKTNNTEKSFGFTDYLFELFLKLDVGNISAKYNGSIYLYLGSVLNESFRLEVNSNGYPIRLEIPSIKLIVTFSNWK